MNALRLFLALSLATSAALRAGDDTCASACCAQPAPAPAPAAALPGDSLYQLAATWQDQDGRRVALADLAGSPVVVSMIFTHCAYACPRIMADLKALRAALPEDVRARVRIVLASFDTARDTPARLHAWAAEQGLDASWTLLHGDADAVRELSVALDIPYLPQPDGGFGHGNRLILLDARGVPVTAAEGLGAATPPLVTAATQLVRSP